MSIITTTTATTPTPETATTTAALVADAQMHVRSLDPDEFAAAIDRGDAVAIDLREVDERIRDGSIHGTIHIPRGMLEFRADPANIHYDQRLRGDCRILLHSTNGDRSALAARTLTSLGYTNIAQLDGGIRAWSEAGLPVYGQQHNPY